MISIISPAKSLDFETAPPTDQFSLPEYLEDSEKLMAKLRTLSRRKLSSLMNISKDLAELNYNRNQEWNLDFQPGTAKAALFAFQGDVYRGMDANSFDANDIAYAQNHVRILSGLHGLLRPLDLIKPYRLEMGTTLPVRRRKNLYDYWRDRLSHNLNEALAGHNDPTLVNLASNEYFKAVQQQALKVPLLTIHFRDWKNGEYKNLMTYSKLASGYDDRIYCTKPR